MNKKVVALILMVFMLCGCSAEVNLNITSTDIYEQVNINAYQSSDFTKEQIKQSFRQYVPAFKTDVLVDTEPDKKNPGVQYYDRKETDIGNGYAYQYSYKFKFNEYRNATSLKEAYKSINIQENKKDKLITLSTDSGGLLYFRQYPSLDSVKVNIKLDSKYKVLNHNADYTNGNIYMWSLSRNNNKNIYLQYDNSADYADSGDKKEEDKKEEITQNGITLVKKEEEEKTGFSKFINEYPFITALIAIVLFLIFVIIASKISNMK